MGTVGDTTSESVWWVPGESAGFDEAGEAAAVPVSGFMDLIADLETDISNVAVTPAAFQVDVVPTEVASGVGLAFNDLLAALQAAGLMATS